MRNEKRSDWTEYLIVVLNITRYLSRLTQMLPKDCQERHNSVPNFVQTYNDFLVQFPTSIKLIGNITGYAQCLSTALRSAQQRLNVTVSENILQATEKLSRLTTVLLQGTQANVAAVESTINSAKVLVSSTETAVLASQAPNEDEDSQLLLTTCLGNIRIASATSNAVSFNSNVNVDVILRSFGFITTNVANSMNHNLVPSSRTKELIQTASLCITNIRNVSERLVTAILGSVNSSENINNYISGQLIGNTAESTHTKFYEAFDFSKFPNMKIKSQAQDLFTLPDRMNKIFINEVKTDGYTCQFTFARPRTENTMLVIPSKVIQGEAQRARNLNLNLVPNQDDCIYVDVYGTFTHIAQYDETIGSTLDARLSINVIRLNVRSDIPEIPLNLLARERVQEGPVYRARSNNRGRDRGDREDESINVNFARGHTERPKLTSQRENVTEELKSLDLKGKGVTRAEQDPQEESSTASERRQRLEERRPQQATPPSTRRSGRISEKASGKKKQTR
ncbi:hypothetical protein EDC94DRAFT_585995 [Helicostylum pulchrum]|nr:hypothetical protein EDC94DRAFT_585995 [Helicostylum pulchrum]